MCQQQTLCPSFYLFSNESCCLRFSLNVRVCSPILSMYVGCWPIRLGFPRSIHVTLLYAIEVWNIILLHGIRLGFLPSLPPSVAGLSHHKPPTPASAPPSSGDSSFTLGGDPHPSRRPSLLSSMERAGRRLRPAPMMAAARTLTRDCSRRPRPTPASLAVGASPPLAGRVVHPLLRPPPPSTISSPPSSLSTIPSCRTWPPPLLGPPATSPPAHKRRRGLRMCQCGEQVHHCWGRRSCRRCLRRRPRYRKGG